MIMATLKKVCYTVQVKAPNKQELVQVFYCIYFSVYLFCLFKQVFRWWFGVIRKPTFTRPDSEEIRSTFPPPGLDCKKTLQYLLPLENTIRSTNHIFFIDTVFLHSFSQLNFWKLMNFHKWTLDPRDPTLQKFWLVLFSRRTRESYFRSLWEWTTWPYQKNVPFSLDPFSLDAMIFFQSEAQSSNGKGKYVKVIKNTMIRQEWNKWHRKESCIWHHIFV